ncbi:ABA4-like family protein [Cerasicoccus maritimus]|uniref:ABA4-like family protein n=1 Tax=Cerasicoccus maritimus TaxID=490089 RepID=UPI00285292B6|nr:ABA4-like family protein [Cerasicoccus maritimus]
MIELFAEETLTQLFWIITLAGAPFWGLMIFLPGKPYTRHLCTPYLAPPIFALGLIYLYYQLWSVGLPDAPTGLDYSDQAAVATHPLVLLILWSHAQILNLFLGESIYIDARKRKWSIPVELVLCWLLGPIGLLVYALRLMLAKAGGK